MLEQKHKQFIFKLKLKLSCECLQNEEAVSLQQKEWQMA